MSFKPEWQNFTKDFIEKFSKINPKINLSDVNFDSEKKSFYIIQNGNKRPLGCVPCISGETWQNEEGDIVIGNLKLMNYVNYVQENKLNILNPINEQFASNVWICPNCNRIIFDFLPRFDVMPIVRN